ncbi:hypothetical protein O9992_24375 [Vibrio lentus]|nr:hypothetical protein [Vibrio lentus]
MGYGYRDTDYFFLKIKSVFPESRVPKKPPQRTAKTLGFIEILLECTEHPHQQQRVVRRCRQCL